MCDLNEAFGTCSKSSGGFFSDLSGNCDNSLDNHLLTNDYSICNNPDLKKLRNDLRSNWENNNQDQINYWDQLNNIKKKSENQDRDYPKENIDYNPDDIYQSIQKSTDIGLTKKPENWREIMEEMEKELSNSSVCQYTRQLFKKYNLVDLKEDQQKPLEYYYDSALDTFYFSIVGGKSVLVCIYYWKDFSKNQLTKHLELVDSQEVEKIRAKLVGFPDTSKSEMVLKRYLDA